MASVTVAEKAATSRRRFEEHPVASRVRGAVGHAMLNHMNVESGSQRCTAESGSLGALHDLLHGEIGLLGVLAME
jgi:hypothetical protein